jgi:hypothetical protein
MGRCKLIFKFEVGLHSAWTPLKRQVDSSANLIALLENDLLI